MFATTTAQDIPAAPIARYESERAVTSRADRSARAGSAHVGYPTPVQVLPVRTVRVAQASTDAAALPTLVFPGAA